jgi:LacI family transcriptional regulator
MKEHDGIVDPRAMMRGEFSAETGRLGWQQIKRCAPLPTAVMCGNDGIAFGVLESLAQDKVNCPGQISVVGFDDSPAAEHFIPKLTTVRQPIAQLGRAATELLIRRLQSQDGPAVKHLVFPTEVIHRQSTAPPGKP